MNKTYNKPVCLKSEVRSASKSVCGWYTQCGEQVKQRS